MSQTTYTYEDLVSLTNQVTESENVAMRAGCLGSFLLDILNAPPATLKRRVEAVAERIKYARRMEEAQQ